MDERVWLRKKHDFLNETIFLIKSLILIILRSFKNRFLFKQEKFCSGVQLKSAPVIGLSETILWTADDNEQNWILTAGKVQNLRTATQQINGIEIHSGKIFSFWKHIGNPHSRRGYVTGREIREGCIVPTTAGGLCQLSNALYDAALKAGFEIIERHRHTKVIKGSLAEIDRDATVKWNYIDLRFRSNHSFRIEAELTTDKLIVQFKSLLHSNSANNIFVDSLMPLAKLNDCYSCGNVGCFKYPGKALKKNTPQNITTFLLDEKWSEYETYIKKTATATDHFIIPTAPGSYIKLKRYQWPVQYSQQVTAVPWSALYRSFSLRILSRLKNNVFSLTLRLDEKLAQAMVRHIPVESTHLVISQNLLPFIWNCGALGGRTFDVLMTRLPMEKIHQRLDMAYQKYPDSQTLSDFRAPEVLMAAENAALTKARYIITPHQEVAAIFNNKSILLDWILPPPLATRKTSGNTILFPASSLGRKGAYEVRKLARELNLCVKITGSASEDAAFWGDIPVEKTGQDPFEGIQLVIYPAWVEHQPRILLRALATGLPVIATTACGLAPADNLIIVSTGNYDALKQAVISTLHQSNIERTTVVLSP
ncbi:VanW family protein [Saccharospirillum mangrovi]|uniref:VanW family protein n=1 Tax=Saccharospirillum mangrovi TaxID=2161747 RepID=UPI000D34BC01|nr:VanW family protein [Saccharospirillum mangrovi]